MKIKSQSLTQGNISGNRLSNVFAAAEILKGVRHMY